MLLDHVVGLIGIALLLLVFQASERKKILWIQIVSNLVWTLYYVMAGLYTAAGLIFLAAVRSYVFERYRQYRWVYVAMLLSLVVATILTWRNWTSVLALCGMTVASTAMWQKDPRHIRFISLAVTPFWLSYNFLNHSYLGMTGDLITFTSVVLGICRFDIPVLRRRAPLPDSVEPMEASL